jgi:FixJ family two-component response regulator
MALNYKSALFFAPLLLYAFSSLELAGHMRQDSTDASARGTAEHRALAISARCTTSPLTPREREILIELMRGKINASIASDLGISSSTVIKAFVNKAT